MERIAAATKKISRYKPIGRYRKLAYRLFKSYDNKPRPGILKTLYKADIQMLPGMYIGTIVLTALIATGAALGGSMFAFRYLLKSPLWPLLTLAITGATLGASLGALPLITVNKITGKRVKIDGTLPFLLAYMATLSSAGMNPVEVIKHVAIKDFGPVSREFQKVLYREEILGEDIVTAMNSIAGNTPSESLRDIMIGINNIIVSGGSLRAYCEQQSKNLFDNKRVKLKSFIESLSGFSEGYIGGVVVTIVMGVIGIIIIGALGVRVLPFLDTQEIFNLFVFLLVPLVNGIFIAMLEMRYSSGEV
jgi:archaeal flagellar protein FlaJ